MFWLLGQDQQGDMEEKRQKKQRTVKRARDEAQAKPGRSTDGDNHIIREDSCWSRIGFLLLKQCVSFIFGLQDYWLIAMHSANSCVSFIHSFQNKSTCWSDWGLDDTTAFVHRGAIINENLRFLSRLYYNQRHSWIIIMMHFLSQINDRENESFLVLWLWFSAAHW